MSAETEARGYIDRGVDPALAYDVAARHSGVLGFTEEVDMDEVAAQMEAAESANRSLPLALPNKKETRFYWGIADIAAENGPTLGQLMRVLEQTVVLRAGEIKELMKEEGVRGTPVSFGFEAVETVMAEAQGDSDPVDWEPDLEGYEVFDDSRIGHFAYYLRARDRLIHVISDQINEHSQ